MQFLYALHALVGSVVVVVCYEMHLSLIYVNGVPLDRSSIPYYKKRFYKKKIWENFEWSVWESQQREREREMKEETSKKHFYLEMKML